MKAPSSEAPRDQDKITAHARKELQAILGAIESYERELWSNDQTLEQLDLVLELEQAWKRERPRSRRVAERDIDLGYLAESWAAGLKSDDTSQTWTALVRRLITASATQPVAYQALCTHAARLLRRGLSLPPPLREYAADALIGSREPPIDRRSLVHKYRNRLFVDLIESLTLDYELNPTRNDETEDRLSACDILATAMEDMGQKPSSYSAFKKIWAGRLERTQAGRERDEAGSQ